MLPAPWRLYLLTQPYLPRACRHSSALHSVARQRGPMSEPVPAHTQDGIETGTLRTSSRHSGNRLKLAAWSALRRPQS